MRCSFRRAVVLAAAIAQLSAGAVRATDMAGAARRDRPLRSEAWLGAGALAVMIAAGPLDRPLRDRVRLAGGADGEWLSDVATPFGTPAVLVPGALLWAASGRLQHHPERISASARLVISVGAAAVASETVKLACGRERPFESPSDADTFRPF